MVRHGTGSGKQQLEELFERVGRLESKLAGYGGQVPETSEGSEGERFCSIPQVPERALAEDVSPFRARLIRYIEKKWANGTKLRYWFFESGPYSSDKAQKDLVREGFDVWRDLRIGVTFEEVSEIGEAEVRIGFLQGDGAWSYVGRDVIDIPGQYERTMNFGWNLLADPRGVDTPVHEIGHTLGFPHEHQNPFSGIEWDEEAVYDYFGGPPNNWTQDKTFYNVLRKLSEGEVLGSTWDPNSIMHYAFPGGLIDKPAQYRDGLRPALGLSEEDIEEARHFYPPLEEESDPELEPLQSRSLSLAPAEQANFVIKPPETREYTIQTFGQSDTVMVLFEDQDGDLRYVDGDDDSGTSLNSRIQARLYHGRKYVLRVRLYSNWSSGETAVMLW